MLRQGIELSERSNNAVHRYKLYQRISEAETALGRYREALDYFKSYHSQADSIFNVERERSINELRSSTTPSGRKTCCARAKST